MDRRSFVQSLGAAVVGVPYAAALRSDTPDFRPATRLNRVGLELYSVRDAMKADPEATLAKVKAMGYDDVELLWSFDNFGRTPQQVRATLEHEGLNAPSAHIAPEVLLKDWDKSLDTARYLGHQYLIVPSLPAETNRSLDAWRLWAERFNNAGAMANKAGVWLAFHNEPEHQKPIDGQIPYDLFLQLTDPSVVRFQLDFGNLTVGGGDPLAYLQKYRSRFHTFHIKDVAANRTSDTELGAGTLDLRKLLAAIPEINNKPCFVEQESPADPLASAAKNCAYLKNLEF